VLRAIDEVVDLDGVGLGVADGVETGALDRDGAAVRGCACTGPGGRFATGALGCLEIDVCDLGVTGAFAVMFSAADSGHG
jgi:hypothetical protein